MRTTITTSISIKSSRNSERAVLALSSWPKSKIAMPTTTKIWPHHSPTHKLLKIDKI